MYLWTIIAWLEYSTIAIDITLQFDIYLCIVNFVLVQNLITKLLIHMSQRQSAVEWNAPCLFLFKIYLPRNIKLHINEKIMTEIYKSNSDHYAIHKIYASCNILKNNGAVGGTILPEVVSCLTANPQLPALWSIFAYDPHSDTLKKRSWQENWEFAIHIHINTFIIYLNSVTLKQFQM